MGKHCTNLLNLLKIFYKSCSVVVLKSDLSFNALSQQLNTSLEPGNQVMFVSIIA